MRTKITLIVGLSTVFLFLSIYGTPSYVNGQSSTPNSSPGDNETSSTNSALKTENLDPFGLKGSSDTANTDNSNDPAQADDGSSANSNTDDDDDGSSANSNTDDDDDGSSANSNTDDDESSANSKNDNSNKDGSADDKSSKDDKESKDDKKFELPFP